MAMHHNIVIPGSGLVKGTKVMFNVQQTDHVCIHIYTKNICTS